MWYPHPLVATSPLNIRGAIFFRAVPPAVVFQYECFACRGLIRPLPSCVSDLPPVSFRPTRNHIFYVSVLRGSLAIQQTSGFCLAFQFTSFLAIVFSPQTGVADGFVSNL